MVQSDYSVVQLWRLAQNSAGEVSFVHKWTRGKDFKGASLSLKTPSCRYACGAHTLANGWLTLAVAARDGGWTSKERTNIETYIAQDPFGTSSISEEPLPPSSIQYIENPDEEWEEPFTNDEVEVPVNWGDNENIDVQEEHESALQEAP